MSDELVALLAILPTAIVFVIVYIGCFPLCKGKCVAYCCAKKIPDPEAQEIINSMQGDWDVTLQLGICSCCCTSYERMTVTGDIVARLNPGRGGNRPIVLRPARTDDGTLLLDEYGSKAIVFTPEQGYMETRMVGYNCGWRKVGWQGNMAKGQGSGARQAASSGQGGVADEIQRLNQLKQQGVLTVEEFAVAKYKILNPDEPSGGSPATFEQPPPYSADLQADKEVWQTRSKDSINLNNKESSQKKNFPSPNTRY